MSKVRSFFSPFRKERKGFTLIELLVVVAILGFLAAVAIPNVGRFINRGKVEAKSTELHNIQTGVMALLAESDAGVLDDGGTLGDGLAVDDEDDMDNVTADSGALTLSEFVVGLDADNVVKTGVTYDIELDGKVIQN